MTNPRRRSSKPPRSLRVPWADWPREEILDLRMCDLGIRIAGTWLESCIERVCQELEEHDLRVRPRFWFSDEWFCPTDAPGVAIPFYLAHPRLMRLERRMLLEVEGGTRRDCVKLLRHELGHVVQYGYRLHRRRRWQRIFGRSSDAFPEYYKPTPRSRRFVQHLPGWYAQAHAVEDFAETFAVWLRPGSDWRREYADWPALEKLEYVDELMEEIAGTAPLVVRRARVEALPTLRKTLREHYAEKQERYSVGDIDDYDRDLIQLFGDPETQRGRGRRGQAAAAFVRKHRRELRERVIPWTGGHHFVLDHVMSDIVQRCRQLKLRAVGSERELKIDLAILLTSHMMLHLYRKGKWRAV